MMGKELLKDWCPIERVATIEKGAQLYMQHARIEISVMTAFQKRIEVLVRQVAPTPSNGKIFSSQELHDKASKLLEPELPDQIDLIISVEAL